MKLGQAIQAYQMPTGTPIVAVDDHGKPTAIGIQLSGEAARQPGELAHFAALSFQHSEKIGQVATALSSGLDVASNLHPNWMDTANDAGSMFAFVATGLELGNAVRQRDALSISAASFRFGANALDLLDKSGVLGSHPALHTMVLIAKSTGSAITVAVPKPKK